MPKEKLTATHHAVVLTCISFLYTDILFIISWSRSVQRVHEEKEKQAKTLQYYSSEPVYSPRDKLLKRKFFFQQKWKGKTPNTAVFFPPNISPLSKNMGGLVVQRRKANLQRTTLTIMHNKFSKNLKHLISPSKLNVQSKIKISGGSFYNRPKPFSGLT